MWLRKHQEFQRVSPPETQISENLQKSNSPLSGQLGTTPDTVFPMTNPQARIVTRAGLGVPSAMTLRPAGGAGLGLAIARGIAEAHGGSLELVAADLGGAAFRLVIPL